MTLYFYPYELLPRSPLNAKSGGEARRGILLKSKEGGVGCLQPWPELGDYTLQEEMDALIMGNPLPLGRRALVCMEIDAAARRERRSLFEEGKPVPRSYASLPGNVSEQDLLVYHEAGFRSGKCKGGRDVAALGDFLERCSGLLPEWSWRIDFNGVLAQEDFPGIAACLQDRARGRIRFFEDPSSFEEGLWNQWMEQGLAPLADRLPPGVALKSPLPVRVWKPAMESWESIPALRAVVTSYMDHPVGQAWAACEAARLMATGVEVEGGLITHSLFEENEFSEILGGPSPVFPAVPGLGLGFDDLLDRLSWKKLR